jgi:hypothetical protein
VPLVTPELAAKYVLTTATGSRAVFNDRTDADYVGPLTEHSGFDSPEIREEQENRPGTDGGVHGMFLFGRRPMTMKGKVLNPASAAERAARIAKLQAAVFGCMRADGTLAWTTIDGTSVSIKVRAQQPLRIEGAWQKDFQIALVAADPRIYSTVTSTSGSTTVGASALNKVVGAVGDGTAYTWPVVTIYIPVAFNGSIVLRSLPDPTTGIGLLFDGTTLPVDPAVGGGTHTSVKLDMQNNTVTGPTGSNLYGKVDPTRANWIPVYPGANTFTATFNANTASAMTISWKNAWW